jgi:hypothetical protein
MWAIFELANKRFSLIDFLLTILNDHFGRLYWRNLAHRCSPKIQKEKKYVSIVQLLQAVSHSVEPKALPE